MNEALEQKLWSWVLWNFRIKEEEKRDEIIAAAYVVYEGIPREERNKDLLPHATITACLVVVCLHVSKEYRGTDLRFICKNLVIEPQSVIGRFKMPINYVTPMRDVSRENGDVWIDPKQSLDVATQLIQIPPHEVDAELNLNKHVLDFAAKLFGRGIATPKPAPDSNTAAQYLELAENNQLNHKVRFIALCLSAAFQTMSIPCIGERQGNCSNK